MISYQPTQDYLKNSSPFVGVVVNNIEPERNGITFRRGYCQIRIDTLHDSFDDSVLPWASPRQTIDGKSFRLPVVGRIVNVYFPTGDVYHPEYDYAEHYDSNLQSILDKGTDERYVSTTAVLVDNNTQFWVDNESGLTMDYKNSGFNIDKTSNVNIRLADVNKKITFGTDDADQPIILGKNFLEWFDMFVDHLSGAYAGPYFGNLGAPVIANPAFIALLQQYKAFKNPRFLSKNGFFVDNFKTPTRTWSIQSDKDNFTIMKDQLKVNIVNS